MKLKDYLTESEIDDFLEASRETEHGIRDHCMMLITYRHGLRVSELIDLRLPDIDLKTGRISIRRLKGSISTHQPLDGIEIRSIKAWLRERDTQTDKRSQYLFLSERGPFTRQAINYLVTRIADIAKFLFPVNPHMLRHSCGYYLANRGYDTRLIQDYLGHKDIQHTVRYTKTAAFRFEGLWRKR